MKDTIDDVRVVTCGRGIEVRIGGTSISETLNRYGFKTRHEFLIGDGFSSKEEATQCAIKWLEKQIQQLQESTTK